MSFFVQLKASATFVRVVTVRIADVRYCTVGLFEFTTSTSHLFILLTSGGQQATMSTVPKKFSGCTSLPIHAKRVSGIRLSKSNLTLDRSTY